MQQLKLLLEEKRFEEACDYSLQIENTHQNNALFFLYKGVAALQCKQFEIAEQSFLKGINLDKHLVALHKNLALCYFYSKNPKALKSLFLSSWIDPLDVTTYKLIEQFNPSFPPNVDVVFYTASPYWNMDISPDGLKQKAMGGSETAFVEMAGQLGKLGKTVLCFCSVPQRKIFENVTYIPVEEFFYYNHSKHTKNFVSSRFLYPFQTKINAQKKFLWLHDIDGGLGEETVNLDEIDHFLALSDSQIDYLVNEKKYNRKKFIKVKNGFFDNLFNQDSSENKTPNALVYFSRPSRGLIQAVEAFRLIKTQIPNATFHVCCYSVKEKTEEDPDMMLALSYQHEPGIHIHGSLNKNDLAALLQKMSLCLYPNTSHLETFCIVAIEAMAAGIPVISSNRGSLPEVVQHNVGGVILPFSQDFSFVEALAKAALELLSNPTNLEQLSQSAQKRAFENYPWSTVAQEWLSFLV